MRPQAHVAASLAVWSWSPGARWEAGSSALCGNLPDFDRNVAKALGVERRDHHRWVSHSLAGWLAPSLLALAAARRGGPRAGAIRRGVACVWLHLLMDTYADGIAWLWPVHKEKIGLFQGDRSRDRGWQTPAALDTPPGKLEVALWAALAAGLLRRRR